MLGHLRSTVLVVAACAAAGCIDLPAPLPPAPAAPDGGSDGPLADTGADATPDAAPSNETCNGLDDDADGRIDEQTWGPALDVRPDDDPTRCRPLVERCIDGTADVVADRYEADEAECDGLDNDCDGAIDEASPIACVWCEGGSAGPPCNGCPPRSILLPGFVCVPPGTFTMGSPDNQPERDMNEGPTRVVRITRPFGIMRYELSVADLQRVPDEVDPGYFAAQAGTPCGRNDRAGCPVERLSWFDAVRVANGLSTVWHRPPCYRLDACQTDPEAICGQDEPACAGGYACDPIGLPEAACTGLRLPTEAEWAYAARAGTDSTYWSGDIPADLGRTDRFVANSDGRPQPVDAHAFENAFGLAGVHGNVAEWVFDSYAPYPELMSQEDVDPVWPDGELRVVRGGHYDAVASACRSATRVAYADRFRSAIIGVRFATSISSAPFVIDDAPLSPGE